MKILVFLQARMGSTRLPKKVMLPLAGKSVLAQCIERLQRIPGIDGVVVITGPLKANKKIIDEARAIGVPSFSGSEEDLLDRYYKAAVRFKPDVIVRVTADCPLIDPGLIADGLTALKRGRYDLVTNNASHSFPHGLDYEIFHTKALAQLWNRARSDATIQRNPTVLRTEPWVRWHDIAHTRHLGSLRWTLDYPADYRFMQRIFNELYTYKPAFSWRDVLRFVGKHPSISRINTRHVEKGRK